MFKKITNSFKTKTEELKNLYGYGLNKAFNDFSKSLNTLFVNREFFDNEFFEELENKLIELDIMPILAIVIRNNLENKLLNKSVEKVNFNQEIKKSILEAIKFDAEEKLDLQSEELNVILIMGINGVGKTTTISKLMNKYKDSFNLEVVAADTFRAGAIEQLSLWAQKLNVPITKTYAGHSPSAVVYEGIESAVANKRNLLICDTAGRLHNQDNLMKELQKINQVIQKYPEMNKEINSKYNVKKILVLDGTAGKNTVNQAQSFNELTDIDGIIVTKLDTNAKAGMVINIMYELNKPIYFITNGEKVENIQQFDYEAYLELLLGE